jgi:molybdate transport system substrate-binding protein
MIRMSFALRAAMAVIGGLLCYPIAIEGAVANAAEVKVLSSVALTSALNELAPQFERATGNKVTIGYSLAADIRKRILEGETADVIILPRRMMDELQKQDKFAPGTITNIAGNSLKNALPTPSSSFPRKRRESGNPATSKVYGFRLSASLRPE